MGARDSPPPCCLISNLYDCPFIADEYTGTTCDANSLVNFIFLSFFFYCRDLTLIGTSTAKATVIRYLVKHCMSPNKYYSVFRNT